MRFAATSGGSLPCPPERAERSNLPHGSTIGLTRTGTRPAAIVFATACCLYLLTCSGRMGSMDAYTQLRASIQFLTTGSVGTSDRSLYDYAGIPSPDGRYFQAHDPGNVVLLLPAAAVAVMAGGDDPARDVPVVGRVASALIYAIVGAACLTAIYLSLRRVLPLRAALATTVLAGCATPLWIYARPVRASPRQRGHGSHRHKREQRHASVSSRPPYRSASCRCSITTTSGPATRWCSALWRRSTSIRTDSPGTSAWVCTV